MDLFLVLTVSGDVLDYKSLLMYLYKTFDQTLQRLRATKTAQRMCQIRGQSSSDWKNVNLTIYVDELYQFGATFARFLYKTSSFGVIRIVGKSFGQNCPFPLFVQAFQSFNKSNIIEAVLHIAFDTKKFDRAPMWCRDDVVSVMGKEPSLEYFVSCIPGFGNFYFYLPIEDPARLSEVMQLGAIKFYSSVAKHMKDNKITPFESPEIGNALLMDGFSDCFFQGRNTFKQYTRFLQDLEMAESVISSISSSKNNHYARCELLFNVNNLSHATIEKIGRESVAIFKSLKIPRLICFFQVRELQRVFEKNARPCINRIREELFKWHRAQLLSEKYVISRLRYLDVIGSEAILCMMFRGSVISTFGHERHDNKLCKHIGMIPSNFKTFRAPDIFRPSMNLKLCNSMVSVGNTEALIPYFYKKLFIPGVFNYIDLIGLLNAQDWDLAADMLIQFSVFVFCKPAARKQSQSLSVQQTHTLTRTSNIRILSSTSCLDWLSHGSSLSMQWILQEVLQSLNIAGKAHEFNDVFSRRTDEFLLQEKSYLCVPLENSVQFGVFIPYSSINPHTFPIAVQIAEDFLRPKKSVNIRTLNHRLTVVYMRSINLISADSRKNVDLDILCNLICDPFLDSSTIAALECSSTRKLLAYPLVQYDAF
jgi:hypothetical protein